MVKKTIDSRGRVFYSRIKSTKDLKSRCKIVGECWIYPTNRKKGVLFTINGRQFAANAGISYLEGTPGAVRMQSICKNKLCVNPKHRPVMFARDDGLTDEEVVLDVFNRASEDCIGSVIVSERADISVERARRAISGLAQKHIIERVGRSGSSQRYKLKLEESDIDPPIIKRTVNALEVSPYRTRAVRSVFELGGMRV